MPARGKVVKHRFESSRLVSLAAKKHAVSHANIAYMVAASFKARSRIKSRSALALFAVLTRCGGVFDFGDYHAVFAVFSK